MFVQVVGEGQEYRGRIFPRSICFVMATVFVVLHLWSTSSLCVMQFWKEIHSEFTVKALKGQNSAFLQVKFIEFLSVNVNASRVCDIRYKINDFIAFLLLHFSKFDIEWLCPDTFIYIASHFTDAFASVSHMFFKCDETRLSLAFYRQNCTSFTEIYL